MSMLRNLLWTGTAAAILSAGAAMTMTRIERGRATAGMNAVSHIAWGGEPPEHAGPGGRNLIVGAALHTGASFFWATVFEGLFGRWSRRSARNALAAGASTSVAAFVTDYGLVSRRFRPGFEVYLSRPSLLAIYVALAAGFAIGAMRTRDPRAARIEAQERSALAARLPGAGGTA